MTDRTPMRTCGRTNAMAEAAASTSNPPSEEPASSPLTSDEWDEEEECSTPAQVGLQGLDLKEVPTSNGSVGGDDNNRLAMRDAEWHDALDGNIASEHEGEPLKFPFGELQDLCSPHKRCWPASTNSCEPLRVSSAYFSNYTPMVDTGESSISAALQRRSRKRKGRIPLEDLTSIQVKLEELKARLDRSELENKELRSFDARSLGISVNPGKEAAEQIPKSNLFYGFVHDTQAAAPAAGTSSSTFPVGINPSKLNWTFDPQTGTIIGQPLNAPATPTPTGRTSQAPGLFDGFSTPPPLSQPLEYLPLPARPPTPPPPSVGADDVVDETGLPSIMDVNEAGITEDDKTARTRSNREREEELARRTEESVRAKNI